MSIGSLRMPRSARVYTIVIAFSLALTITTAVAAQLRVTIEPVMAKGPTDAPVTIVEFSDYQ